MILYSDRYMSPLYLITYVLSIFVSIMIFVKGGAGSSLYLKAVSIFLFPYMLVWTFYLIGVYYHRRLKFRTSIIEGFDVKLGRVEININDILFYCLEPKKNPIQFIVSQKNLLLFTLSIESLTNFKELMEKHRVEEKELDDYKRFVFEYRLEKKGH